MIGFIAATSSLLLVLLGILLLSALNRCDDLAKAGRKLEREARKYKELFELAEVDGERLKNLEAENKRLRELERGHVNALERLANIERALYPGEADE